MPLMTVAWGQVPPSWAQRAAVTTGLLRLTTVWNGRCRVLTTQGCGKARCSLSEAVSQQLLAVP